MLRLINSTRSEINNGLVGVCPSPTKFTVSPALTYDQQKLSCEDKKMRLCTQEELCPNGAPAGAIAGINGDTWVSVEGRDAVQVQQGDSRLCKSHTVAHVAPPSWLNLTGPEDNGAGYGFRGTNVCCAGRAP